MTMTIDALVLTDPRFAGGTSAAVLADVKAMSDAGLSVGLALMESVGFFQETDTENPAIVNLADLPGVTLIDLEQAQSVRCGIAFFHHPSVFENPVLRAFQVEAVRSVLVAHQPLFLGDGALAFDPFRVQRNVRAQFGQSLLWAPVSGICRQQFRAYAPLLRLTCHDWPNAFDVSDWVPQREKLQTQSLTIGRHGRAHPDKWPATGADIALSLPSGPLSNVSVMGADRAFLHARGVDISDWTVLDFNAMPVADYLDTLDVFSYHHAPLWVESFGRTIAEAMLMGVRCVLSPALQPTFGPHALYGDPSEVAGILDHIRNNLEAERTAALAARQYCLNTYSTKSIVKRFEDLKSDTGTASRSPRPEISPLIAARKLVGFRRRRRKSRKDA
ncbi:MAG: hypothetical protein NXH78_10710 [Hyphomonadaceae bacterium]|nr:hypothetical protein [Hyphomonadaceae bacterium]